MSVYNSTFACLEASAYLTLGVGVDSRPLQVTYGMMNTVNSHLGLLLLYKRRRPLSGREKAVKAPTSSKGGIPHKSGEQTARLNRGGQTFYNRQYLGKALDPF